MQILAPKQRREHPDGQEEIRAGRADPPPPVQRQPAARDDAVQVRVLGQLLAPGMEDREKSDSSPQLLRVGGDLQQRLLGTAEQQVVEHPLVAPDQIVELGRKSEDHVEVRHRQQLLAAPLQPALLVQALALRAVPVAAGVVEDLRRTALITLVEVAAQSGGATVLDGPHRPQVMARQSMLLAILRAKLAEDVSHLQSGGGHGAPAQSGESAGVSTRRSRGLTIWLSACGLTCV